MLAELCLYLVGSLVTVLVVYGVYRLIPPKKKTGGVAVITGASSGIGRALATELAKRGTSVVLAARRKENLDEAVKEVEAVGGKALAVKTDVIVREDCEHLIKEAVREFGGIDFLFLNAGSSMHSHFDNITNLDLFTKLMDVNFFGSVNVFYYALPWIKKSKQPHIIITSSRAGIIGIPSRCGYSAAKFALDGLFQCVRSELSSGGAGGREIPILLAAPGPVKTEINRLRIGGDAKTADTVLNLSTGMEASTCALLMLDAMDRNDRLLITHTMHMVMYNLRWFFPNIIDAWIRLEIKWRHQKKKKQ